MADRRCCWAFTLMIIALACHAFANDATAPTTAPTTAVAPFSCTKFGFSVQPPPDWSPAKCGSPDVLSLVPPADSSVKDTSVVPCLRITVPDLPFHIPGMIPCGSVASGYISDMTKQYPDWHVDERVVAQVPNASARRIVSTFHQNGVLWRDVLLCIVHKDRIFLLAADCPADDYAATRAAFDAMAGSLKWN
jgi:hypothetical protein